MARHIAETGEKPVVLIDYLQIIAPVDVHFTDKQNLDRIVCALKKMSRQYELTVFAISSFNRENYNLEVSRNPAASTTPPTCCWDCKPGARAVPASRSTRKNGRTPGNWS